MKSSTVYAEYCVIGIVKICKIEVSEVNNNFTEYTDGTTSLFIFFKLGEPLLN